MNMAHSPPELFHILGIPVSVINLQTACEHVQWALDQKKKGYVCVTGVHGLMEAFDKPEFLTILEQAYLVTPDGMPLSWLGWLKGRKNMDRVYGPDLMMEVCRISLQKGYTHYLYGGAQGTAEKLKESLQAKFKGLKIVGCHCPPFRPLTSLEESELVSEISRLKPDVIWVGLSTPRQEDFMFKYLPQLDTTLMFGVGAAFDFHSGTVKQAPRWVQRSGLEWLYRLTQEPKRLWKRYARNNTLFLWRLLTGQQVKKTV